jgi:hypothetical protein
MRVLRALAGALLWILASVVCLLALVLCVTVVLLPLGIPLLMLGRRLYGRSIRLFLPRGALSPVTTSGKAAKSKAEGLLDAMSDKVGSVSLPDGRKARKQIRKKWKKVASA